MLGFPAVFGKLPRRVRAAVQGTTDEARLEGWLRQVLSARNIEDLGSGRQDDEAQGGGG